MALRAAIAVLCAAGGLAASAPASAQRTPEARLLREAAASEAQGDFDSAERTLRGLLEVDPVSTGGLFALERVLRAKGDPRGVLGAVDRFLERAPSTAGVHVLKLRLLAELDSLDALVRDAEAWVAVDRRNTTPYREIGRIYERAFGSGRALEMLRRGRSATGDENALALEIGDILASTGDVEAAADEWALAVGPNGAEVTTVIRRVGGLTSGVTRAGKRVVARLARNPERLRAAARIALDLRLPEEALEMSRAALEHLEGRIRASFLTDVARRAREGGLGDVATWAYSELGQEASTPAERRRFDQSLVEVSLAEGDTAAALEAQHRIVASLEEGSAARREATAEAIRLEVTRSQPERIISLLALFRADFPEAPELDRLASFASATFMSRGARGAAVTVLDDVAGPHSSLERAYLFLDAGNFVDARQTFLVALTGLEPSEATEVIQMVGLLGRLSPEGAAVLARASVLAHGGKGGAAAAVVAAALDDVAAGDRAALIAEGARMADRGEAFEAAAELRTRLLEDHPDSPEVAEASLSLARYFSGLPEGRDRAIRLLEELVSGQPNAAVVPAARRELEKLRAGS